jgi:hypothetical protein
VKGEGHPKCKATKAFIKIDIRIKRIISKLPGKTVGSRYCYISSLNNLIKQKD